MKVMVISVHPDDETLGCGGTLLKHGDIGDEVYWLILTEGKVEQGFSEEALLNRKEEIRRVSSIYQFKKVYNTQFPTTMLHAIDFNNIINGISDVIHEVKPETIYMINRSDIHTDHQIASRAIFSCTKSFRYPYIKRLMMYECISETEMAPPLPEGLFIPNVYSDISGYIDKKIEVMKIFSTEIHEAPLPRSLENIRALAKFRGSSVGVNYAEAFMLVRELF